MYKHVFVRVKSSKNKANIQEKWFCLGWKKVKYQNKYTKKKKKKKTNKKKKKKTKKKKMFFVWVESSKNIKTNI